MLHFDKVRSESDNENIDIHRSINQIQKTDIRFQNQTIFTTSVKIFNKQQQKSQSESNQNRIRKQKSRNQEHIIEIREQNCMNRNKKIEIGEESRGDTWMKKLR